MPWKGLGETFKSPKAMLGYRPLTFNPGSSHFCLTSSIEPEKFRSILHATAIFDCGLEVVDVHIGPRRAVVNVVRCGGHADRRCGLEVFFAFSLPPFFRPKIRK
jgi:hypothetical protein